jgi:taurine dioxygenase
MLAATKNAKSFHMPDLIHLTPHIGGRVKDLDVAAGLNTAQRAWLLRALLDRKVLVLPSQTLSAESFHAFAGGFGSLQHHVLRKYRHADYPGLSWLTNVATDGSVDSFGVTRATNWHSDGSYSVDPPALGMLYALEIPSRGGGTIFADMANAYDALPDATRQRLAGFNGLHRHGGGPGGGMYDGTLGDDQKEGHEDVMHPAVTRHPQTERQVLYVNTTHTRKFAELAAARSVELINSLVEGATTPDNLYTHNWQVGDVLMWDQRSTMHRGAGDYPPTDRRVKLRAIVQSLHDELS